MLVKKDSPIHGTGIFTTQDIAAGTSFYAVPTTITDDQPHKRWARIGEQRYVCDEHVLNYVNHSCQSNARLDISAEPVLVARRDIRAGEEITVDYDETETGEPQTPCSCASANCRGRFRATAGNLADSRDTVL